MTNECEYAGCVEESDRYLRNCVDLESYTVSDKEPKEISEVGLGERKYKMKSMDSVCIFFITCVCVCVCMRACERMCVCLCAIQSSCDDQ